MDRIDATRIRVAGADVRVVPSCPSTNSALLAEACADGPVILAAEAQTAGRGRRGRRWHSAPGTDITFSLGTRVRRPARELAALSLVAGIAAARALRRLGVERACLKWPNDLLVDGTKLGGILVETRAHEGAVWTVVGLGINVRRSGRLEARLRRPVAALEAFSTASRNAVIEAVALALLEAIALFEAQGFEALRPEWESMDAYAGRRVRLRLDDGRSISGIAAGLARDGALRLRTRHGETSVRSGRVLSARAA